MSGFVCPHCTSESKIFKSTTGGAKKLCEDYNIPLLGKVPLDPLLARCCDEGKDFLVTYPSSPTTISIKNISNEILKFK